jgi:NitT/TauT family transport system substrate-binding protein
MNSRDGFDCVPQLPRRRASCNAFHATHRAGLDDCCSHGLTRRDMLRLSSAAALTAVGLSVPLLSGCRNDRTTAGGEPTLRIGYLPILDAAPLLVAYVKQFFQNEGIRTERPVLIRGWSELSEAFLSQSFNLVHLLIPVPIYMRFAQNYKVKVVAWNHINGSALTAGLNSGVKSLEQLGGKHIAVPYWYSIHNIVLQLWLRHYGLEVMMQDRALPLRPSQANLLVMKPPDMPTAMQRGSIDAYIVAEPFDAAGEVLAEGRIVRFTGDSFKNHPCCVATMHERELNDHPDWAQKVLNALVKAQKWLDDNREEAAHLLAKGGENMIPLEEPIVKRALIKYDLATYGVKTGTGAIQNPDWHVQRIGFQPYPYQSATVEIVKLLKQTKLEGDSTFLSTLEPGRVVDELFDYNFVKKAAEQIVGGLAAFPSVDKDHLYERKEIISV